MTKIMERGALIVIEGMDRTGKSTQCKKLVANLRERNIKAEYMNFPDRTTNVGQVINSYLTNKTNLSDEVIHLLFSANRWESRDKIIDKLRSGTTLIVDRYCFSGVAFSAAKGLDLKWCKAPDVGLPKPDKVFFLTMPLDEVKNRNGFGEERYEVLEFQEKVLKSYLKIKEDSWDVVVADRSIDEIQDELFCKTFKIIKASSSSPIGKVWNDGFYNQIIA